MIIITGEGSGKTRVLTIRIAYLMSLGDFFLDSSVDIYQQGCARNEGTYLGKVGSAEAKNIWMGTFHSAFAQILQSEADKRAYPSNFIIYERALLFILGIIKEMQ